MSSVNKVILLGRLGADPELRYTQNQTPVCTLKMATNERRKGADGQWTESTEWHTVVTFGKTAENCNNYLQKGRLAYAEGRLQTKKYQDQDGKDRYWTEIVANTVQFIGGRENMDSDRGASSRGGDYGPSDTPSQGQSGGGASVGAPVSFDDDDIPF